MTKSSDAVAVFTYNTLELFRDSFCEPSEVLKRSAILFDRLLFYPYGIPTSQRKEFTKAELLANLADVMTKDKHERGYLMQSQEFFNLILLADELIDDTKAFYRRVRAISKNGVATKRVNEVYSSKRLSEVVGPERDTEDIHTWYSWKSVLQLDFCLFDATREVVPSAVGLFTELHEEVIRAAAAKLSSHAEAIKLVTKLEKLSIADFAQLSWTKIFELRHSGFLTDFRQRLSKIAATQSSGGKDIEVEVFSDLWRLVADVKPDLPRSYLTAILGNIPLPVALNPISLIEAAADINKQRELKKHYGWLFFIHEGKKG